MNLNISNNKFFNFFCYYSIFNSFLILFDYVLRLFSNTYIINFLDNNNNVFYYFFSFDMLLCILVIVELERCIFSDFVKNIFSKISKSGFFSFLTTLPFIVHNFNNKKDFFLYFFFFSCVFCLFNIFYSYYAIKNINLKSFKYDKKKYNSFFEKHFYSARYAYGYLIVFFICVLVLPSIAIFDLQNSSYYDRYGFLKKYVVEKHLTKNNKSVYLVGMTHRALASFYDNVLKNHEPDDKTIILLEGIRKGKKVKQSKYIAERDEKWKEKYPYLKVQSEYWRDFLRFNHISGDISYDQYNSLFQNFFNSENMTQSQKKELHKNYYAEVIIKRNDHLLNILFENIEKYNVFIIPWGSGHMKDLEKKLIKKGFIIKEERLRKNRDYVLDIKNLVFDKINKFKYRLDRQKEEVQNCY